MCIQIYIYVYLFIYVGMYMRIQYMNVTRLNYVCTYMRKPLLLSLIDKSSAGVDEVPYLYIYIYREREREIDM